MMVTLVVALSLALVFVLRRTWPPGRRTEHNEIIGWQVSVLGTTYAVMLGFMLYAVWSDFQAATVNTEAEANSLMSVYRLAEAFPKEQRDPLQQLALRYADTIIRQEWPAMSELRTSPEASRVVEELWGTGLRTPTPDARQNAVYQQLLAEITKLTESRRVRLLQSDSNLPPILWIVLTVGCAMTITSASLFGTENFRLHLAQVFALSLVLSLLLATIADINRPFQGGVHVDPTAMQRAQDTMRALISERVPAQ
jgi:hypothetical protein